MPSIISKIIHVNAFDVVRLYRGHTHIIINHELGKLITVNQNDFGVDQPCILSGFFPKS